MNNNNDTLPYMLQVNTILSSLVVQCKAPSLFTPYVKIYFYCSQ